MNFTQNQEQLDIINGLIKILFDQNDNTPSFKNEIFQNLF